MILTGLPDFQAPIAGNSYPIYPPFEGRGRYTFMPDRLVVAETKDGRPDFSLELVRGKNVYGVLDFRLRPNYRGAEALALVRRQTPGAMLDEASFESGFLRLQPKITPDTPKELGQPTSLAWNGLSVARQVMRLTQGAAVFVKNAIQNDLLTFEATAELEMIGVSPRLPVRVRFDPPKLLAALAALAESERRVSRDSLLAFFRRDPRDLPLEITGTLVGPQREDFAAAMTDRVRVRFGSFVPAPKEPVIPYYALVAPDSIGSGRFDWDLAEPMSAPRPFVLSLHPLEGVRELVKARGLNEVYRETTVPPLPTGFFSVTVLANLFPERPNVEAIGVSLRVPPKPPQRLQAVNASVELTPPEDEATLKLRLSPTEKLEYTYTTSVVINSSRGSEEFISAPVTAAGEQLSLSLSDFPVDFVPIEATAGILEEATIHGVCRWGKGGARSEQSFDLDENRTMIALALPKGAAEATLEIEARARTGGKALKLGPLPAEALKLDLLSFVEYGPHQVEIECAFGNKSGTFVLELLPEGRPETKEEISVLGFTRDQAKREWSWFADSPFQSGYRFRPRRAAGESAATWTEVRSLSDPLRINVATGGTK